MYQCAVGEIKLYHSQGGAHVAVLCFVVGEQKNKVW